MAIREYLYVCRLCGKRHRAGSGISAKHKRLLAAGSRKRR